MQTISEIKLEIKDINDVSNGKIISVIGVLDATNLSIFSNKVIELMEAGYYKLIFDYSKLEYINSTALGQLVTYRRKCFQNKGDIYIVGCNESITEICNTIGLTTLIGFYKTLNEAIAKAKVIN